MFRRRIAVSGGAAINSAGPRFTAAGSSRSPTVRGNRDSASLGGAEEFVSRNLRFLLTNEFRS
jgi:hypothetical protein